MADFVDMTKRLQTDWYPKFSKLVNFGTYSPEEYLKEAVHLPEHPEHSLYLEALKATKKRKDGWRSGKLKIDCGLCL